VEALCEFGTYHLSGAVLGKILESSGAKKISYSDYAFGLKYTMVMLTPDFWLVSPFLQCRICNFGSFGISIARNVTSVMLAIQYSVLSTAHCFLPSRTGYFSKCIPADWVRHCFMV
jgi:hypothetical protein